MKDTKTQIQEAHKIVNRINTKNYIQPYYIQTPANQRQNENTEKSQKRKCLT